MIGTSQVGDRVRLLRTASGKSQTSLSEALGLKGNTTVSKIETGRMAVDDGLALQLAGALGCTVELLRRPGEDLIATRPWLRAYADASAKVVDRIEADNVLAHEFFTTSHLQWVPDSVPLFDGDVNDDEAIEEFAGYLRTLANVPEEGPVGNAVRAAEWLGCVVLPLESELGKHLGMSQRLDGRPFIRIGRAWNATGTKRLPGDRQRFTVSHELGHLALHSQTPPPQTPDEAKRLEKQAHRFAAAFLAPAQPLLDDWQDQGGRVTLGVLQRLKANWGVSIKMLVNRFSQLRVIDNDQARSLYRQISARGWNTTEPVDVTNEEPIWVRKALQQSFPSDSLRGSEALAAAKFGIDPAYVSEWTDWTVDLGSTAAVTPLSARPQVARGNRRTRTVSGRNADVIALNSSGRNEPMRRREGDL